MTAERTLLVGVATRSQPLSDTREHLRELSRLAWTAGAEVIDEVVQTRQSFDPTTLIGAGKLAEIRERCEREAIDLVIFDDDLTGSQAKAVTKGLGLDEATGEPLHRVLDRSGLILDIFARNARTRESRLQVEIAQLQYMLPRLTRAWVHFGQQGGGIGTRGPGETQLEVDRRRARDRLSMLKKTLVDIEVQREAQSEKRRRGRTFSVALAGYTNAGKSTLLNAMTKAGVLSQDKLFSTLEATSRRLWLGQEEDGKSVECVLSDTVGFIRKLPHHLVASFRSTLSVVGSADLVLHLVDGSAHGRDEEMRVAREVLDELCGGDAPRQLVFTHVDLLDRIDRERLSDLYPDALQVSGTQREGLDTLRTFLKERAQAFRSGSAAS